METKGTFLLKTLITKELEYKEQGFSKFVSWFSISAEQRY
jgi:hypothetical protein